MATVGLERKANGILSHPFHFLFLVYKMKRDGLQFSVTNHALTNPIYWYHLHCICKSCRSYRKEINSKKTPKTTVSILQRYVWHKYMRATNPYFTVLGTWNFSLKIAFPEVPPGYIDCQSGALLIIYWSPRKVLLHFTSRSFFFSRE